MLSKISRALSTNLISCVCTFTHVTPIPNNLPLSLSGQFHSYTVDFSGKEHDLSSDLGVSVLTLTPGEVIDKLLNLPYLTFFICKMGIKSAFLRGLL